jgi:hypothetical protein
VDRTRPIGRLGTFPGSRPAIALPILLLALLLLLVSPASAATDNVRRGIFEERAAAEKLSRSQYRGLEVASLVVILLAGGGAIYWVVRRKKP